MTAGRGRWWGWSFVVALAVVIAGGVVLFRVAVGVLKDEVTHALGPKSEIAKISVGWSSVDVEGVRIHGANGVAVGRDVPGRQDHPRTKLARSVFWAVPGTQHHDRQTLSLRTPDEGWAAKGGSQPALRCRREGSTRGLLIAPTLGRAR